MRMPLNSIHPAQTGCQLYQGEMVSSAVSGEVSGG
jgi:hypothetical protein